MARDKKKIHKEIKQPRGKIFYHISISCMIGLLEDQNRKNIILEFMFFYLQRLFRDFAYITRSISIISP